MKVMVLIKDASKDKLRGGFYTPKEIADFMLKQCGRHFYKFEVE
jgi:hypothetical protein